MIAHNSFHCLFVYVYMYAPSPATNKFISHLFNWKNLRLFIQHTHTRICENIFCNNNNFQLLLQLRPKNIIYEWVCVCVYTFFNHIYTRTNTQDILFAFGEIYIFFYENHLSLHVTFTYIYTQLTHTHTHTIKKIIFGTYIWKFFNFFFSPGI